MEGIGIAGRANPDHTEHLVAALRVLGGEEAVRLAAASQTATLLRLVESALASHPTILAMLRAPQVYLGSEEVEVRQALESDLGQLPRNVIDFLIDVIRGGVPQRDSKTSPDAYFAGLVERDWRGGASIYCQSCGYRFERANLGVARLAVCDEAGVLLSERTLTGRLRDPWKRPTKENRQLTIDHVIPEASLGPTRPENLRIVCGFCNRVRRITWRYEELLVSRAAAALLAIAGGQRGQWAYEAAVFFSVSWRPYCMVNQCGVGIDSRELTGIPVNGDRHWTGLLPWQLETRCYEHADL